LKRLQFSKCAHDLLGDLDLGTAIVFDWSLWGIEVVDIDRAMLEIEVNGALPVLPAVNDVQR
jgi:hypothetical protein